MGYFDLLRFELDAPWFVARYKSSVAAAVKQVFDTSGKVVGVEGSHPMPCKADDSAANARPCSWCWAAQCWRFVTLRDGVRYFTVNIIFMFRSWEQVRIPSPRALAGARYGAF
jgi:hypothetical protein